MVLHIHVGRHARLYHIDVLVMGHSSTSYFTDLCLLSGYWVLPISFILFPHTSGSEAVRRGDEKGLELAKQSQDAGFFGAESSQRHLCQGRTRSNLWQSFCTTSTLGLNMPFGVFCVDRTLQVLKACRDGGSPGCCGVPSLDVHSGFSRCSDLGYISSVHMRPLPLTAVCCTSLAA